MPAPSLSVIIPTLNEEANVAACLQSVSFADEIVVVDSFSTDRTVEIAGSIPGVRVLQHEYRGNGPQCNWAMDQVTGPWILIVDADERVPGELAAEIRAALAAQSPPDQFRLRRENLFLGRAIRRSGWGADRLVRLLRKGSARYPEKQVHADIEPTGSAPTLSAPLRHETFQSFNQYLEKLHRYAEWGAADLFRAGRRAGILEIAGRPVWRFFRSYVVERGFLDGGAGLIVCGMQAYGTFLKWARLWEMQMMEVRGER